MVNFRSIIPCLALLCALVSNLSAAVPHAIESSRSHAAVGTYGGTITAATNASPAVMTITAHGFISGDQIQITGATTLTAINVLGYAKVVNANTFSVCDVLLTTCTNGNGVYDASSGKATKAHDVSTLTGDFTIRYRLESLTAAKNCTVVIQESATGFTTADVRTIAVFDFSGSGATSEDRTVRKYQMPSTRAGTASVTYRAYIQSIDSATTLVGSFFLEY